MRTKYAIGGLLFLVALSLAANWRWVFLPDIFTSGDWGYISQQAFREALTVPKILAENNDFASGSITPMFDVIVTIGSIFSMNFELFERLLFFWPMVFLGPLPIYALLYRKFHSALPAVAGSMAYCFNTYLIARQMTHLHIAIAFLFAPLLVLATEKLLYKPSAKSGFWFILTTAIFSVYEIRILYIMTLAMIAYGIYLVATKKIRISKQLIGALLGCLGILTLMQAYWLIPFAFSNSSLGYVTITGRGLFNSFTQISHALTLSDPFWQTIESWTPTTPQWWLYAVPIVALLWIFNKEKRAASSTTWFWVFILCIGIFILKQANPPFPHIYQWLYDHMPGFRLFRESSKFMVLPALAYALLIGQSIAILKQKSQFLAIVFSLIIIGIFIPNIYPIFTGSIEGLTTPRTFPKVYSDIQQILESDPYVSRSFWIPATDRFAFSSETHPSINANAVLYRVWNSFIENPNDPYSFFEQRNAKSFFNFGSIKYIAAPFDSVGNIYKWYPKSQEQYNAIIGSIPGLSKIPSSPEQITLWNNPDAKPHFYIANNVEIADNPISFSGIDQRKETAFVFKKSLSEPLLNTVRKTVARNEEIEPFAPHNLVIANGAVETSEKIAQQAPLITVQESSLEHTLVPILANIAPEEIQLLMQKGESKEIIATIPRSTAAYWAQVNKKDFFFSGQEEGERLLGTIRTESGNNEVTVLREADKSPNLIENGSFENGTWSQIGDCNNIDASSLSASRISSSQSSLATNGQYSLQLSAGNHLGCTWQIIAAVPGATMYRITFDYRFIRGNEASFKVVQDAPNAAIIASEQLQKTADWANTSIVYENQDANPISLYLYQAGDLNDLEPSSSLFDNFSAHAYETVLTSSFEIPKEASQGVIRPFAASDLRIVREEITGKNLISDGSFEQGKERIGGDCNNSDNTPLEENGIRVGIIPTEHGSMGLSMQAKRHIACISLPIASFDPAFDYLLSITFKSEKGTSPSFAFYPRINESLGTTELANDSDASWQSFKTIISGEDIAPNAQLFLYVSGNEKPSQAIFEEVSLIQTPILPHLYVRTEHEPLASIATSAATVNPTLHTLASDKILEPRMLVLSDKFDSGWQLFVRPQGTPHPPWWKRIIGTPPGTKISANAHLTANAFVNGWILDPQEIADAIGNDALPEFVMEYWPQRLMDAGTTISLITVFLFIGISIGISLVKAITHPKVPLSEIR